MRERLRAPDTGEEDGVDWLSGTPFLAIHLVPFAALVTGFGLGDLLLAAILYLTRMLFVTGGYHRYFSHRSYRLGRWAQLMVALGGVTAAQKGPVWWASHHRRHHRHADREQDVHSPRQGLWWSHVGWILSRRHKRADTTVVPDLTAFPELVIVDRWQALGPWLLGGLCYWADGWRGVVAFALSTVLLWHATFAVNSLGHLHGRRTFDTPDDSRNSWLLAILTLGEGWHNNHHHAPRSVRQGFDPGELDPTFWIISALASLRLASELCQPNEAVLAHRRAPAG